MITDAQQLLEVFELSQQKAFFEPVLFRSGSCGFSVKRLYPADGSFRPAKNRRGSDDIVALIKLVAYPSETDSNTKRVPLSVAINQFSIYLNNNFDYSETDPLSPTKAEREKSKASTQPMPLNFDDDYFINLETGALSRADDRPISPLHLLEEVFQRHVAPTRLVRGVSVRARRTAHRMALLVTERLELGVQWFIEKALGFVLIEPLDYFPGLRGYRKEHMRLICDESIEMFGYRASQRAVVFLGSLGVLVATAKYMRFLDSARGDNPGIGDILDNNFFSVCFVVVGLFILDSVVPRLALGFLNLVIRIKVWLLFRPYRVNKFLWFYI
jgi:hypothetical protein